LGRIRVTNARQSREGLLDSDVAGFVLAGFVFADAWEGLARHECRILAKIREKTQLYYMSPRKASTSLAGPPDASLLRRQQRPDPAADVHDAAPRLRCSPARARRGLLLRGRVLPG